MSRGKRSEKAEVLGKQDLEDWLVNEIGDVTMDTHLRLQEAAQFVTAYLHGKLSPEEASDRFLRYEHRWATPLAGQWGSSFQTKDELLAAIDQRRGPFKNPLAGRGFAGKHGRDKPSDPMER